MDDSLIDKYLEQLNSTKVPGVILAQFFCELYNLENIKKYIQQFSRLAIVYNRKDILLAILDTLSADDYDPNKGLGLIIYILKNKLTQKLNPISYIDVKQLEFRVKEVELDLDLRPIKDPFEENNAD